MIPMLTPTERAATFASSTINVLVVYVVFVSCP